MALVRGCHVIAKGDQTQAAVVALKILQRGLLVNRAFMGTIETTLKNLIVASDVAYLKTVRPAEFEQLLVREVQFLAPYDEKEELEKVELYIHQHLTELYQFVQALAEQKQLG